MSQSRLCPRMSRSWIPRYPALLEIVLTDEEAAPDFSDEYSVAKTELWKDPQQMDMPGANPFQVPERVDLYSNQETASIIE